MTTRLSAADTLVGRDLDRGWKVVDKAPSRPGSSNRSFCVGYYVERRVGRGNVDHGYMKALDLRAALEIARLSGVSFLDAIQQATERFQFERDVVMQCANARMGNVVFGRDHGELFVDHPDIDPIVATVPYIIFERAEGDVRQVISEKLQAFDEAWMFRILHGIAKGLQQLHGNGIEHQDLKPANVMAFPSGVGKIGDLGHASTEDRGGLFDDRAIVGDPTYAAPELLYGEVAGDQRMRRRAADAYNLGSLLVYLLTGMGLTAHLDVELGATFHWRTWPRDYRNVLPYVREAFNDIVDRVESDVPMHLRADVVEIIRHLCDPDPHLRGDGIRGDGASRYSMERFITRLDRLARRAEVELGRAA